jgi:hypothetical protein
VISFKSVGHAFAFALEKIHAGLQAVEKVIPAVERAAPTVEGITALIPGGGAQTAVAIERVAFGVLGGVAAAVKTLITDFKSELQAVGVKAR